MQRDRHLRSADDEAADIGAREIRRSAPAFRQCATPRRAARAIPSANCEIRLKPTNVRSTSANRWPASAVGASRLPRRSNSASLSVNSRSRMSRLTAGCVTCIVVAADVTLPVVMTARNASTCLGLSIARPCLMVRHQYNISVFHMRIIRFDLIRRAWDHCVRTKAGSFTIMRTVFLSVAAARRARIRRGNREPRSDQDIICSGLWRLVRADDAQGHHPAVRKEARREDRIRRRQFDRHAREAAGAERQPADRRRHRR